MRVVIDSNSLRTDELRCFLSAAPRHRAVLIDYASMEAYKTNPLLTIGKSMAVLGEFPRQVLVLRSTGQIARLDPRKPRYVQRMIWTEYTRSFPRFAASLPHIELGDPNMIQGAVELGGKARDILGQLGSAEDARHFRKVTAAVFSTGQVRQIKSRDYSAELQLMIIEMAVSLAEAMISSSEHFAHYTFKGVLNHFAVRHSLCRIIQVFQWIRSGRSELGEKRLQNDAVDTVFATFGSLFNGVMSKDAKLNALHTELRDMLLSFTLDKPGRILLPQPYRSPVN